MKRTRHGTPERSSAAVRPSRVARQAVLGSALGALLSCAGIGAAAPAKPDTPESIAKQTLLDAIAPALEARGATAVVTVSALDARRVLAPCNQFAGFMPPGARLAGRTTVGVRCVDGAAWQTFVSAEVRVEASTWQSTRALRAGDALGSADVVLASTVLTAADLEAARAGAGAARPGTAGSQMQAPLDGRLPAPIGRIVQRPVAAGRPLTASDVRDEGRIAAGDPVRVIYHGDGFAVSSDGRATSAADPGAPVSIRLASGALVSGTLRADHLVELPR